MIYIAEVETFIKAAQSEHPEMRGPWLAELELKSQQGKTEDLPDLIKSYFSKFGSKLVTYSDMTMYLSALDRETQKRIHAELSSQYSAVEISSVADICRDMILVQLDRFCGNHQGLSEEESQTLVTDLLRRYESVQHLVENMVSTDIRPSDEYLVLASHILWTVWLETGLDKYFSQNISLLAWALTSSPANWQVKLLMTRLLTSVGAAGAAFSVHAGLDIKHLMLDSLGWVLDHHLTFSGLTNLANQVQNQTVKLYTQVSKDTADHIITAYRTGTFYQIRDIYNLRQRILSSYNLLTVDAERQLSIILHETSSHSQTCDIISFLEPLADKEELSWASKRDNRDLETMVSWDPPHCRIEDMREKSLEAELLYGRTRQLVVKCVQAAVVASLTSQENDLNTEYLTSFSDKLQAHWKVCLEKSDYRPAVWLPQSPSYPDLAAYNKSYQIQSVTKCLEVVVSLLEGGEGPDIVKARMASVGEAVGTSVSGLAENIEANGGSLLARRELLQETVWLVETLGLTTALSGVIFSIMRGGSGKGGKKAKKGKGLVLQQFLDFTGCYTKLTENLEQAIKTLERSINVRFFQLQGYILFPFF